MDGVCVIFEDIPDYLSEDTSGFDSLSLLILWHKAVTEAQQIISFTEGNLWPFSMLNLHLMHVSCWGKSAAGAWQGNPRTVKSPRCKGCGAPKPTKYWSCCAKGWLSVLRVRKILLYLLVQWSDRLEVSSPMSPSTRIKMPLIHYGHSLYCLKWQEKAMSSLKNLHDILLEFTVQFLTYTEKLSEWAFLKLDLDSHLFLLRNQPLAKRVGESPSLSLTSFIFHSSLELQKFTFLWKDKLAFFSLLTATDPAIHTQLPLS